MEFRVKDLNKIDWDEVFPGEDVIIWDNKKWRFSDIPGHFPGFVGPVLETVDDPQQYVDTKTGEELKFFSFDDSFLNDNAEGEIGYLLPVSWDDDQLKKWFEQYKIDRNSQEDVRNEMLDTN